ncbi:MAG: cell division ATP-binding protein FtsE [Proteobacteria bacterium]|nr:cell division ATP-binding protein FtsE [Pseudomonadota bacterium]MBU1686819.1 cell division ATP-binding protein FtsE [Pseudomonadota bacterium]
MLKSFSEDRPFIDITKVTKVYPPDIIALQNVSLSVDLGEILFLTGMSGAGKTTLLKLICCMETPNKGLIDVGGYDLSKISASQIQSLRQQIGVVYQDFKILPRQTVFQNIAMPMEVCFTNVKDIRKRVDQLLESIKLTHKRDTVAGKLSRGEQQRVAIARAASNSPALILADEPTGNLDAEISEEIMKLFTELNAAGSTVIIATHDESIYRNTEHRRIELEHGLFSRQTQKKQLSLTGLMS